MKKLLLTIIMSYALVTGYSQATILGNSSMNPSDFLGWNAQTQSDLSIGHYGNENLEIEASNYNGFLIMNNGSIGIPAFGGIFNTVSKLTVGLAGSNSMRGVWAETVVTQQQSLSYGGSFRMRSNGLTVNRAVEGDANLSAPTEWNYGIYASVCNYESKGFAVVARAYGSGTNHYAG
ncbi:MAG: hypothetical protein LC664_00290 [Flavobacteriales bacterium]|nr:hypothetical protein [Flavobacteriales bacterium]